MGITEWFKRLFSPSPDDALAEEERATLRAEYGEGGFAGLARIEDARAREDALEADEPPPDPAP
jgi:hypothetical protein